MQPSVEMETYGTEEIICASVLSSTGDITYGGVDEEGNLDPASRRHATWVFEEYEEEGF